MLVLTDVIGTNPDQLGCTSARMAASAGTHPVVVRRILGSLREAGLVSSRSGPGGGWHLARDAEAMTLLDICRAVEDEPLLAIHEPSSCCPIGAGMRERLHALFAEAEAAMERQLANVTLADVVASIRDPAGCSHLTERLPGRGLTIL